MSKRKKAESSVSSSIEVAEGAESVKQTKNDLAKSDEGAKSIDQLIKDEEAKASE